MSGTPTVSIGTPVYNGEASIGAAIDSLLAQTFADFELVISDNASTDGTEAICRDYAARDRRVRYVRQERNRGPYPNFAFVLQEAAGEFFMWAAADDSWSPGYVAACLAQLRRYPRAIAATTRCQFGSSTCTYAGDRTSDSAFALVRRAHFLWDPGPCAVLHSLFRARVIKRLRIEEYGFNAGDWAIVFDLLEYGNFVVDREYLGFAKNDRGLGSNKAAARRELERRGIPRRLPLWEMSRHILRRAPLSTTLLLPILVRCNVRQYRWLHS